MPIPQDQLQLQDEYILEYMNRMMEDRFHQHHFHQGDQNNHYYYF